MARKKQFSPLWHAVTVAVVLVVAVPALAVGSFASKFQGRIIPGVIVDGVDVGGKTFDEAVQVLDTLPFTPTSEITFSIDSKTIATPSASLGIKRNSQAAARQAMRLGRETGMIKNIITILSAQKNTIKLQTPYQYNPEDVEVFANILEKRFNLEGKQPSAKLGRTNAASSLTIFEGKPGRALQKNQLLADVLNISSVENATVSLKFASTSAVLNKEQIAQARKRAEKFVGIKFSIKADDETVTFDDITLVSALTFPDGLNEHALTKKIAELKEKTNRPPQDAKFKLENTQVVEFQPHLDGRELDTAHANDIVLQTITGIDTGQKLPKEPSQVRFTATPPKVTLGQLNDLGIKERIGFGESTFYHSIANRIHNVALTSKKISMTLIPPGGTFSFNKALGEVSNRTGFLQAYVISGGRTVLGDGGGVCQVSTTVFRAALNAGLPIVERRGHAYRVGYYEQNSVPGLDATVYAPSVDLKFKNDTPGYILLTTTVDTKNYYLSVELWGTSDGRKAEIRNTTIWDQTPPKATIYQDDPNLPAGTLKQVDWSAPGAKTSFEYYVTRNGELLQQRVFKTVYQPWAAVYLRGTKLSESF